nr:penicillin acylase family protein [Pseudomonas sp. RIT-PI-S]
MPTRLGIAALTLLALQGAQATPRLAADIRWTAYGVPHIRAADERGLGFGIGYAYAWDNACLLLEEALTARGERSRYFGGQGQTSAQVSNLASDLFYTWLNRADALAAFDQAQPSVISDRLEGYVAGFNRYLNEAPGALSCAGQPWVRPLQRADLLSLARRLLVEGGLGQFIDAVAGAAPPGEAAAGVTMASASVAARAERLRLERGSNAVAVGDQRAAGARSLLLANPHFPWSGAMRFYQLHLTIPGQLDVMGAALPGLPLVNIGFNQHLAWTHTVDTSSHFTLYRLALDPARPDHYLVDGRSVALRREPVSVSVKGEDGQVRSLLHTLYVSEYGPLLNWPGRLGWTGTQAWAIRDANLENTRVLGQWDAINRADSTATLQRVVSAQQGIPWVNTLAADDNGRVLYLNRSVVPNLSDEQLRRCGLPQLIAQGLPGLRGDLAACAWRQDPRAAQPGIVPAEQLPALARRDLVQNSNDSAWLTQPAQPLEGYSPLVSRSGGPLGARARFALGQLEAARSIDADALRNLVTGNRVASADWVLPDLLAFCAQQGSAAEAGVKDACAELAAWDRTANLSAGPGLQVFAGFMARFADNASLWRYPFDPADPLHTPRGIDLANPASAQLLRQWLAQSLGERIDAPWGQIQVSGQGADAIPVPGADGHLGVYNAIQSVPEGSRRQVISGSSYLQLVRFTAQGPEASGLLAFSQASEPASPQHQDQTRLFSAGHWPALPFTERQIADDPALRQLHIEQ